MKPEHSDIPELLEWLQRKSLISFILDPMTARRYMRLANILSELSGVPMSQPTKPRAKKQKGSPT